MINPADRDYHDQNIRILEHYMKVHEQERNAPTSDLSPDRLIEKRP